jgi:carbon monoxide dehydrogenase subunit G
MSTVTASIDIAATPAQVWDVVMNPSRLGDWVTIHRKLLNTDTGEPGKGFEMDQQIHLRGVSLEIHWKLIECRPRSQALWEGRGPARSHARTEYKLHERGDGSTRFDYLNDFRAPLGPIGALASRALVGGIPEREARRTLERLRALLEHDQPA